MQTINVERVGVKRVESRCKYTKMMTGSENGGNIMEEGNVPRPVYGKVLVNKRCTGKLKEISKFSCQICVNQQTDIAEECTGVEVNDHSLENVEWFCYHGEMVGARAGVVDSVKVRTWE